MGPKGPTLHEVAARAGVSIATVSRVARGLDQISESTRSRVLSAIEELQYRPSHFGRALVKQRHGALGVVFPGLRGPYYSEVIHGFELEAIDNEMSLLILGTEHLRQAERQVLGMADRSDGLAIMGGTLSDELIRQLVQRGVPVVTMARLPLDDIPTARVDSFASTHALVTHLIRDHHATNMVFVGSLEGSHDGEERWRAFLQAHHDAHLTPPDAPRHSACEQDSGVQAARAILALNDLPDAVVCGNDEIATGVLGAFTARGVRVPEDVAVTGWDDSPWARYVAPPLTTVAQPARVLGQHTARLLLTRIARAVPEEPDVVLPCELVIRASCGCAFNLANDLPAPTQLPSAHVEGGAPIIDRAI